MRNLVASLSQSLLRSQPAPSRTRYLFKRESRQNRDACFSKKENARWLETVASQLPSSCLASLASLTSLRTQAGSELRMPAGIAQTQDRDARCQ